MQEYELGKGNKNGRKKLTKEIKYRQDFCKRHGDNEVVEKIVDIRKNIFSHFTQNYCSQLVFVKRICIIYIKGERN